MKNTAKIAIYLSLALSGMVQANNGGTSPTENKFTSTTYNLPGFMSQEGMHYWDTARHPRMLADVNGDGKDDLVGFHDSQVVVAFSNGRTFDTINLATLYGVFGYYLGEWRIEKHPRMMADINGDGKDDIVAFANGGVGFALSNGNGFDTPKTGLLNFGYDQGWRVDHHERIMADVNGDGMQDIVGFGGPGVSVAISNGNGFNAAELWSDSFGDFAAAGGWIKSKHPRLMADINGDGLADVVGFGYSGVHVAFSNGSGFDTQQLLTPNYGYTQGWRTDIHPRIVKDINGDGKADIVGFSCCGVYVAISTGTGFNPPTMWLDEFAIDASAGNWQVDRHPRVLADVTGDGLADVIGFNDDSLVFSSSTGTDLKPSEVLLENQMSYNQGYRVDQHLRMVGDINGDGLADVVAINDQGVSTAITEKEIPLAEQKPTVIARYKTLLSNTDTTNVSQIPTPKLIQVSGNEQNLWGVNNKGRVFRRDANSNEWIQVSGNMRQVAVQTGALGIAEVWAIDANGYPHISYDQGASWVKKGNITLSQITVGQASDGQTSIGVRGIDTQGRIASWRGDIWDTYGSDGSVKQISPGFGRMLWGVNGNDEIFYMNAINGHSDQIAWGLNTKPKEVFAVSGSRAVVLDSEGHLYLSDYIHDSRRLQENGTWLYEVQWKKVAAKVSQISYASIVNGEFGEELQVTGVVELNDIPTQRFDLIGLDINGDGFYERVLKITNQSGDSVLVYKPLAIAYLLKNAGINLTRADIERFSPIQRKALAAQPDLAGLTVDDSGNVQSYDETAFNNYVDSIVNIQTESGSSGATWTTERVNSDTFGIPTETTRQSGSVQTYHVTGNFNGNTVTNQVTFLGLENTSSNVGTSNLPVNGGSDSSAYLIKAENTNTFGSVTTGNSITVGESKSTLYANDKGFAVNQSLTVVGVESTVGAKNSTHAVIGASVGWGAGIAGTWGQGGLYGGEIEVGLIKVGFYISGDDATTGYNESKGWLVGAANDTAGWSEQAWQDSSSWFANTTNSAGRSTMQFINHAENWSVNAVNDGRDVAFNIAEGTESITIKIRDASSDAVNIVGNKVDTAIVSTENIAVSVGNSIANTSAIAGNYIESTADTVGGAIIDLGNAVRDGFCGIFGC